MVVNADPFRLRELVGPSSLGEPLNTRLDSMKRLGTTIKVNMALKRLPKFKCLPEEVGQHRTTTHLLPEEDRVMDTLSRAFQDSQEGRLPDFPAIEWYARLPTVSNVFLQKA